MSRHTPGPWTAFHKPKYDEWQVSVPCENSTMHEALFSDGVPGDTPAEREGNAHLIAAAPDLLEAARDAYEALGRLMEEGVIVQRDHDTLLLLAKAITKAEGQTHV